MEQAAGVMRILQAAGMSTLKELEERRDDGLLTAEQREKIQDIGKETHLGGLAQSLSLTAGFPQSTTTTSTAGGSTGVGGITGVAEADAGTGNGGTGTPGKVADKA
ncbi:hypothetical protein [Streptomyces sp. V4I8]|uniref:hypothetical protein n=1 Tax=Streptomyces sp. V4I8 TaxID=3156469 RepID=UPI003512C57E